MTSSSKRRDSDIMKLMMNDFKVESVDNSAVEYIVEFHGPKNSPYEGGMWNIRVCLPDNYPYSSPSIGFVNRIFHPNVDEISGSVCLDLIGENWSPKFDLSNVFDAFLPQLLIQPNPEDPLNRSAARLMNADQWAFDKKVREYVELYAQGYDKDSEDDAEEEETDAEDSVVNTVV